MPPVGPSSSQSLFQDSVLCSKYKDKNFWFESDVRLHDNLSTSPFPFGRLRPLSSLTTSSSVSRCELGIPRPEMKYGEIKRSYLSHDSFVLGRVLWVGFPGTSRRTLSILVRLFPSGSSSNGHSPPFSTRSVSVEYKFPVTCTLSRPVPTGVHVFLRPSTPPPLPSWFTPNVRHGRPA